MDKKRTVWLPRDEEENIRINGVSLKLAKQVIMNEASIQFENVHGDYAFIGITDDIENILYVYCIDEDGFRRIKKARKATISEANTFFIALSKG